MPIVPQYVWIIASVNIFLAYTLGKNQFTSILISIVDFIFDLFSDGIDGKQARRTKTSSPLGELFDHGVDSYSAAMIPIFFFAMFGTRTIPPYRMYFVMWNVFLNFYLTHFEKYNTGVLYLPWAYDVTMWVSATILH